MNARTLKTALKYGSDLLASGAIEQPIMEARLLLAQALSISYEKLILAPLEAHVNERDFNAFCKLIERRSKREPIAYITAFKEFYSLPFEVNENVLIPRPDSEVLVDSALKHFKNRSSAEINILDLGTGSGCLFLTILKHLPNARGIALDASQGAIDVAKRNYANLQLKNKVEFVCADWSEVDFNERFDLIISNPPYIESSVIETLQEDVKAYEPLSALDGGASGLDCYRQIMPIIAKSLRDAGSIALLECGKGQDLEVSNIARANNLAVKELIKDLAGVVRVISVGYNIGIAK